jgi:hypothetical protein
MAKVGGQYNEDSEYGGTHGGIQPAEKGHQQMTARENRTVQTVYSGRTAPIVNGELPSTDMHYDGYREIVDNLPIRTWGRTPDEQPPDRVG